MRFLADENVSRLLVQALRANSLEVEAVAEIAPGASDLRVLELARERDLALITEDRDFGELIVRQGHRVSALILLELDGMSPEAAVERASDAIGGMIHRLPGNLAIVEPARIRLRPLKL